MQAGLEVSLNGAVVGRCSVSTARHIHVNDCNKMRSNTVEEEIECAIALVCWAREDDLLATHDFNEFTVKGIAV